ncbi:DUF4190 domain-containing protein [Gimesia chilikensis]|uniref:DUF4190 domain-containing protein n=1 Tax=Gimesia chilikensis TaxID=2605989 RepID=UPI0011ED25EA|nr:DUF4190 domain-containing protein [Gimesia chilikensis]KAA0135278.1 DUF4190 domain-containing protein [Gimesia chilikensis]
MAQADLNYTPVAPQAVLSLMLGVFCTLGLFIPWLALLAIPGLVLGLRALKSIRRYELSGHQLARRGIQLSLLFGVLAPVWHLTWYEIRFHSEALPGYTRIDFAAVTKNRTHSEKMWESLLGQPICLKGFAEPRRGGLLQSFRMTSQRQPFSFGSQSDPREMIMVQLPEETRWEWCYEPIAVSGTLVRNPDAEDDPDAPRFLLKQSTVLPALTSDHFQGPFAGGGGC